MVGTEGDHLQRPRALDVPSDGLGQDDIPSLLSLAAEVEHWKLSAGLTIIRRA
nr:hypothetical protein [Streptomyces sp. CZ24]